MTEKRSEIFAQLKSVARRLTQTPNDSERRNLLREFRILLDRVDELLAEEQSHVRSDTTREP